MSDELVSNIAIASNINHSEKFIENVFGFDELVALSNKYTFYKSAEQLYLYRQGARPYYCNDKFAWGFIKTANNKIVQSCRCEKTGCSHYAECMKEPNAKKILRKPVQINDESLTRIEEPKWINLEGKSHP